MNLQDIKKDWENQYTENRNKNNLVLRLFNELYQSKISLTLNKLRFYNIIFMLINLIVIIYTWMVLVENITHLFIAAQSILLLILSKIVFYKNVWQLDGLSKINYSGPITEVQKTIERIKIQRIKHNRFIFIFSILYFWLIIAVLFKLDFALLIEAIWVNTPLVVIIHLGFFISWFPIAIWILRKYDNLDSGSKFWKKMEGESFLTDNSVNSSLNNTLSYLKEIEDFQKNENFI